MKCSTAKWTMSVTAAALLALAPAAYAQTPTTPPADQQPAAQATAAQEHLRQAKAALNDVQAANLTATGKRQVAELNRRLGTLERPAARGAANWGVEVAAMDKILTAMLGAEVQTTGTTGTSGKNATKGKAAAAVTLDDTSRTKLTEVRTHLTAYAAAMAGNPTETTTPTTATTAATATSAATTAATQPPTEPTTPAAATTPTPAPAAQANQEQAKRHLTEARNSLSGLTQLPAAAQLTGDARTQVSQLISNFNELITTTTDWRSVYAKVEANMTSLLGPNTATPPAATTGAVGTSGTATITIDPGVREKLVEMRKHLTEFERVAGGGEQTSGATAATSAPASATPTTAPTTAPTGTTGMTGMTPTATAAPQGDAAKHFTAIDMILRSQDEGGGLTLDKAKVELLRTHIAELRKLLERK